MDAGKSYPRILDTLPPARASAILALYRTVPTFGAYEGSDWNWDGDEDANNNDYSYSLLGDLALHVVDSVERGDVTELPGFLEEVERLLRDGDDDIEDLVVIEVIEGLHHRSEVIPYLGPKSREWWNRLLPWFDGEPA